jgi:hypothetical protein
MNLIALLLMSGYFCIDNNWDFINISVLINEERLNELMLDDNANFLKSNIKDFNSRQHSFSD